MRKEVYLMRILTKEWFTTKVMENQVALYRTALTLLKNTNDAEDAVQEAIIAAYQNLQSLRNPKAFKPWILRIVINKCYEVYRSVHPTLSLEEVEEVAITSTEIDNIDKMFLYEQIKQLPQELRVVITLFYYEDLRIKEIADILGISRGAVKTRLYRGRNELKVLLRREEAHNE